MASWWNSSGGLAYHFVAWRQKRAWREFRAQIGEFLNSHVTPKGELLLIGPSGGYTLPSEWLGQFEQIMALDPDPLAPLFFRRNHPGIEVHWSRRDYFIDSQRQWRSQGLDEIAADFPHHTLFFTNLIGQFPFLLKKPQLENENEWRDWREHWRGTLESRRWISVHDLFSSDRRPHPPLNGSTCHPLSRNLFTKSIPGIVRFW